MLMNKCVEVNYGVIYIDGQKSTYFLLEAKEAEIIIDIWIGLKIVIIVDWMIS